MKLLRSVKTSALSSIKELCSKFHHRDDSQNSSEGMDPTSLVHELFHCVAPKVVECINTVKIAQVHIAASECLLVLTELYRTLPIDNRKEISFMDELSHLYDVEKSEQAKSLLRKCLDILRDIKQENTSTVQG